MLADDVREMLRIDKLVQTSLLAALAIVSERPDMKGKSAANIASGYMCGLMNVAYLVARNFGMKPPDFFRNMRSHLDSMEGDFQRGGSGLIGGGA